MLFWHEVFHHWIPLLPHMDFSSENDRFDTVAGCIISSIYWALFTKSSIGLLGATCAIFERTWISCNLNEWPRRLSLFDRISIGLSTFWITFLSGLLIDQETNSPCGLRSSLSVIAVTMSSLRRRQSHPRVSRTVSDPSKSQVTQNSCLFFQ